MKNSRNTVYGCALAAGIILFVLLCLHAYQGGKACIRIKAQTAFDEAIDIDFHRRLDAQSGYKPRPLNPHHREKPRQATKVVEVLEFGDTIETYRAEESVLQYLLAESHPLSPDSFNLLFRERLVKQGIHSPRTGIVYIYKGKKQYSRNDSACISSVLLLPVRTLDAKQTAHIQGWIKPRWDDLLAQLSDITKGSLIGCALILSALCLLLVREHRRQQWLMPFGEPARMGKMVLYKESSQAYINGRPCPMKKADFDLLWLFVQTPSHTLSKEDIKRAFWPKEDNPENKIYYHISILKTALKPFPKYQIELDAEKNYRLIIR